MRPCSMWQARIGYVIGRTDLSVTQQVSFAVAPRAVQSKPAAQRARTLAFLKRNAVQDLYYSEVAPQ